MVYQDCTSLFDDLQIKDGSVCIHHRNIQLVAIEMFKVKYNLCPEILKSLFQVDIQILQLKKHLKYLMMLVIEK